MVPKTTCFLTLSTSCVQRMMRTTFICPQVAYNYRYVHGNLILQLRRQKYTAVSTHFSKEGANCYISSVATEVENPVNSILPFNCHQSKLRSQTIYTSSKQFSTVDSGDKSTADESTTADSPKQQLSQKERIKKAVKEYGSIVVVFHVSLALTWLGASYFFVSTGVDVIAVLYKIGCTEEFIQSKMGTIGAGASTFVVAYAFYKVFAPVRIGITLTVTPFLVRYLRSLGVLRKPPVS